VKKCPIEKVYWTKRREKREEMSDRRCLTDKQEGLSVKKCPIEKVYWTKRMEKCEKVSDRKGLMDIQKGKARESVR
jgi:hypothetical protein